MARLAVFLRPGRGAIFVNAAERGLKGSPVLYSRSLPIFFCLMLLVKRNVLNTKTLAWRQRCAALPGFSYFTSISTSAAQHTSPGKVGHSCGIHRAAWRPRGEFTSAAGPLYGSSLCENYLQLVAIITGAAAQFVCCPILLFRPFLWCVSLHFASYRSEKLGKERIRFEGSEIFEFIYGSYYSEAGATCSTRGRLC